MLTILTISEQNITDIVGYAGGLVGDLMPLLIVIIGISIGGFVITTILNIRS